jgi:hypothetical protein
MIKRIIIGLVFAATFAVLVLGGINRTMAKTSDEYGTGSGVGAGQGQSERISKEQDLDEEDVARNGNGGQGRRADGEQQQGNNGIEVNLADEHFTELIELDGKISGMDLTDAVLIETESGQIALEGRGLSFAVSDGFNALVGDDVQVQGFYEETDFEIVQIVNLTSGLVTTLREPTGRPLWAGGGRAW